MIPAGWIKFGDIMRRIENPRAGATTPTTGSPVDRGDGGSPNSGFDSRDGGQRSEAMRALAEQMKRIG